jgi:membrane-associated phospholipid phosphatase
MAQGPTNSPFTHARAPQPGTPRSRSLILWAVLLVALAVAFFVDGPVMSALAPLHRSALAGVIVRTVRWLGTGYVQAGVLLLVVGVSALLRLPAVRAGAWALLSFAVSGAGALALKVLIHRARPGTEIAAHGWPDYLRNSEFHSFPSGESTTTFAIAVALGWWYPALRTPLLIVAAVVGIARVVAGVHFPSDVVAGALLGVAIADLLGRRATRKLRQGSAPAR